MIVPEAHFKIVIPKHYRPQARQVDFLRTFFKRFKEDRFPTGIGYIESQPLCVLNDGSSIQRLGHIFTVIKERDCCTDTNQKRQDSNHCLSHRSTPSATLIPLVVKIPNAVICSSIARQECST